MVRVDGFAPLTHAEHSSSSRSVSSARHPRLCGRGGSGTRSCIARPVRCGSARREASLVGVVFGVELRRDPKTEVILDRVLDDADHVADLVAVRPQERDLVPHVAHSSRLTSNAPFTKRSPCRSTLPNTLGVCLHDALSARSNAFDIAPDFPGLDHGHFSSSRLISFHGRGWPTEPKHTFARDPLVAARTRVNELSHIAEHGRHTSTVAPTTDAITGESRDLVPRDRMRQRSALVPGRE